MGCLVDLERLRISLLEGNRIRITDFEGKLKENWEEGERGKERRYRYAVRSQAFSHETARVVPTTFRKK